MRRLITCYFFLQRALRVVLKQLEYQRRACDAPRAHESIHVGWRLCFYGQKTHFERPNKTLIFNIPSISVIFFAAENGWTWRGGQNSLLAGPQYSCIHSSTFSSGGNILILEIPAFSYFNFVHFQPDLLKNAPNVNYKKKTLYTYIPPGPRSACETLCAVHLHFKTYCYTLHKLNLIIIIIINLNSIILLISIIVKYSFLAIPICLQKRQQHHYEQPNIDNCRMYVPCLVFDVDHLGLLLESDWDPARLCGRLVQPGLRVQRAGRDLARHPPLREGRVHNLICWLLVGGLNWQQLIALLSPITPQSTCFPFILFKRL